MAKIIDLFKKKKKQLSYDERRKLCEDNAKVYGYCTCQICTDKGELAEELAIIANDMVLEYVKKTGNQLYNKDWLEICIASSLIVKELVFPSKK